MSDQFFVRHVNVLGWVPGSMGRGDTCLILPSEYVPSSLLYRVPKAEVDCATAQSSDTDAPIHPLDKPKKNI